MEILKKKKTIQRFLSLLGAIVLIINFTTLVDASPGENLKDGLKIIINAPKRIGQKISEESELEDFKPAGIILGFFKGMVYTFADIAVGVTRVITFPIDFNSEKENSSWIDYTIFDGDVLPDQ